MRVFITGDRQESVIYPGQAAMEIIRALAAGDTLATGSSETGVEAAVRGIANATDIDHLLEVVENPKTPEGYVDWDGRHQTLAADDNTRVVAIHADPHASRVVRSVLETFADANVTLRTPVDLV